MNARILTLATLAAMALAGCSRSNPNTEPPPPAPAAGAAPAAPTNRIDIPATVRSNLGITFAPVERRRVDKTIRVPGTFELQPRARNEYRMMLPGQVSLEVEQYQQVEPGDVLYRFRSPQWPQLQQEILDVEREVDLAAAEVEVARARVQEAQARVAAIESRLQALAAADLRQADLDAQAAELHASLPRLEAETRLAETRLNSAQRGRQQALQRAAAATGIPAERLVESVEQESGAALAYQVIDWIEVRAANPGTVEILGVTDGGYVDAHALILSTVDPQRLRFRASALQGDLAQLGGSPPARIVPPATPGISIAEGVDASFSLGLEADPQHRTVSILAVPQASQPWMRPGVSAFLEVITDTSGGPALAIPRAAIVRDGITHVFFRRDPLDPNKAIRVEADMGPTDGRWVVINSGISLRDEVVHSGAYELKLAAQQSGSAPKGGHFHSDGTFHSDH